MQNFNPQAWQPIQQTQTNLLPAKPNHPFYYKWHPSAWQFVYRDIVISKKSKDKEETTTSIRKGFFVPHIRMERIIPGVNGVHQINGELGNPSSRIGSLQQQGWVYLDPQRYDYMHVYQCRGGKYHTPKFNSIKVVAGQLIEKFDKVAFENWCISLLMGGVLGQPEPHFWNLLVHQKESARSMEQLAKMQHIPEKKADLDIMYQTIKDMKLFCSEYEKSGMSIYADIK